MDIPTNEKATAATLTAFPTRQVFINKTPSKPQSNLDKSGLRSPPVVLDTLSIRYRPAGARLAVYCPFHKGGKERNPSLMMDLKDGHYKCFTCGAKGGDVIAFYRTVTGAGFMEALKELGKHHGKF